MPEITWTGVDGSHRRPVEVGYAPPGFALEINLPRPQQFHRVIGYEKQRNGRWKPRYRWLANDTIIEPKALGTFRSPTDMMKRLEVGDQFLADNMRRHGDFKSGDAVEVAESFRWIRPDGSTNITGVHVDRSALLSDYDDENNQPDSLPHEQYFLHVGPACLGTHILMRANAEDLRALAPFVDNWSRYNPRTSETSRRHQSLIGRLKKEGKWRQIPSGVVVRAPVVWPHAAATNPTRNWLFRRFWTIKACRA